MACFSLIGIYILGICTFWYVLALRRDQFGTKTVYEELGERTATDNEYRKIDTANGRVCEAVQMTGVYRHGARNPSEKYITSINSIVELLKKKSPTFDWKNPLTEKDEKLLNTEGEDELLGLGQRAVQRLSSVFDNANILSTSSEKTRTSRSARKYLEGFLPGIANTINKLSMSVGINNTLIRFYDKCTKYIKSVDENDTALEEIEEFEKGQEIKDLIERVKTKLNLEADQSLDLLQVKSVYQYCALETGLFNKSIWCQALEDKDLEVMEYYNDLENYWKEGYGYPINYEAACPLVSNIFNGMSKYVKSNGEHPQKSANLFFGHSQTILGLLASFGLYKDTTPLKADGMEQQKNRKLKSSEQLPFAANLVLILYRCNGTEEATIGGKTYSDQYVTKLFHNEKEINFPGCSSAYCPYSYLSSKYASAIECDFEKLCTHVVAAASHLSLSVIILVASYLFQAFM